MLGELFGALLSGDTFDVVRRRRTVLGAMVRRVPKGFNSRLKTGVILTLSVRRSSVGRFEAVGIVVRTSRNSMLSDAIAGSRDEGADRAVDRQAGEVGSAEARELRVVVREGSQLKHRIVRVRYTWNEVGRAECDLLSLGEVVRASEPKGASASQQPRRKIELAGSRVAVECQRADELDGHELRYEARRQPTVLDDARFFDDSPLQEQTSCSQASQTRTCPRPPQGSVVLRVRTWDSHLR